MSTDQHALFQGVEGAGGPSQAGMEDTSVSDVSDRPTACHSGVQVEQQTDSQVNTGRADAEAVRQSHGGAKRRRESGGRLDTRFDDATLGALRTRAKRLGLAPSTWVRTVVRDALHAARLLTAWMHGFSEMQRAGAFRLGGDVDEAFSWGVERLVRALAPTPSTEAALQPSGGSDSGTET